ncbi:helix-turn-helix domain-containing protein [Croceivirga radicis]|uniref:helix-turn-helix domain-containing protein n=1 Tax=Croceivirga radicis TaxID=1929488 RepID=UPI000255AFD1|nr:helix-turn-helix domain-containing protein [Croceivirga radicis]
MAKHFDKLTDFNTYLKLPKPLRSDIDVGEYGSQEMRLSSAAITTSFYRISLKYDFDEGDVLDNNPTDFKPKAVMFFSSPSQSIEWNAKKQWSGFYIHLTRNVIAKNKHLFFNFMEYGRHEELLLNEEYENKIAPLFKQLCDIYSDRDFSESLLFSYSHLIFTFIEHFYSKQFQSQYEKSGGLIKQFVELLNMYYEEGHQVKLGTPTVGYFADKLFVTPSYLGDVIRTVTGDSPIEHIHQLIISEAKILLKENKQSNSEIAYQLGFEYPNYFARLFKKYTGLSPTEYKQSLIKS